MVERREVGPVGRQATASSAMTAPQRSRNRRRRSASEPGSPGGVTGRKYWRCSAKPAQQRAAAVQRPKPCRGEYRCFTPRWSCSILVFF